MLFQKVKKGARKTKTFSPFSETACQSKLTPPPKSGGGCHSPSSAPTIISDLRLGHWYLSAIDYFSTILK